MRHQAEPCDRWLIWTCGSVAAARDKGLYRMEGKEYIVKDGDVLLFKFNV